MARKRNNWRKQPNPGALTQSLILHLPLDDTWSGRWPAWKNLVKWHMRQQRKLQGGLYVTLIWQWSFLIIIVGWVNQMCFICWLQDSLEEQASRGSFVAHGHQDVLTTVIGRPKHPGHVRATGANVTIKQYFGLAWRSSHTSISVSPEDLK